MLEVGAVVHAGGQHHHRGLGRGRRCGGAQGFQQQVGVMRHRGHAVLAEQVGEQPHHHLAVFEHVAHAAGHAQIVFEHVVLAVAMGIGGANDVDARNLRVDVVGHIDAHHHTAELCVVQDLIGRNDAGTDDVLIVVDVVDEAVQGGDPLDQAFFHRLPFVRRDDARNQVKGDQALGACTVFVLGAIDRKGDADAAEDHLCFFTPGFHHLGRLSCQPTLIRLVVGSHGAARDGQTGVHLVKFQHGPSPAFSIAISGPNLHLFCAQR